MTRTRHHRNGSDSHDLPAGRTHLGPACQLVDDPLGIWGDAVENLWCPIDARHASGSRRRRAQQDALTWAARVGLVRDQTELTWAATWNVAEFAGRVYAEAEDLSLAAEWILWMDIVDDAVESYPADQLSRELEPLTWILCHNGHSTAPPAAGPLVQSLADLWQRTRAGMSPVWCARVAHAWRRCADSMPWEAANRAAGRPPHLDDYIATRPTAGAAYLALLLTEGLCNYELTDALHHCGPLSALRTLACDQICWANDLLSLGREEQRGDVHNLVIVLEQSQGLHRQQAIDETVRMTNERMRMISLIVDALPAYQHTAGLTPEERRLMDRSVDSIEQWIAGSLEFHQLSTRHLDHHSGQNNPFRAPR